VTDDRDAERERKLRRIDTPLSESEDRFTRFMERLPGLAWIKDIDGRYVYANDSAVKAFHSTREELYGRTDVEVFSPETAAFFRYNDLQAAKSDAGVRVIERLPAESGEVRHSIVSKFPIPGPDGAPAFIGGMAIDITDRMRAEEALQEADRRKDEFLATLAHELRNPLAPIRNGLAILRNTPDLFPVVREMTEMMERQVHHLIKLVDDLLELSRISRGSIELQLRQFDLRESLRNAVETSQPAIDAGNHHFSISLPDAPLYVEGDEVRLAQIFSNLLNNAAKYTPNGGSIVLSAVRAKDRILVTVADSGVGIPPKMLQRVFDMFAQVDRNLRQSQTGLGIGLSLVKSLVTMHGGTVTAQSAGAGMGSEFVVMLPALDDLSPPPKPSGAPPFNPALLARHRVLVIDDNRDAADTVGVLLRLLGTECQVVYDGIAALEMLETFRPTIMVVDLGMAGVDGHEVARRVRANSDYHSITLIALTGWGQEEDRKRSREAGFDHHLVKPADFDALRALLTTIE